MLDVRFFSEMKMRRERVLKKMNDKISDQHEKIREVSRQGHRLGQNFEYGRGQHKARAERQKIFQILPRPFAVQDEEPARIFAAAAVSPSSSARTMREAGTLMDGSGSIVISWRPPSRRRAEAIWQRTI